MGLWGKGYKTVQGACLYICIFRKLGAGGVSLYWRGPDSAEYSLYTLYVPCIVLDVRAEAVNKMNAILAVSALRVVGEMGLYGQLQCSEISATKGTQR